MQGEKAKKNPQSENLLPFYSIAHANFRYCCVDLWFHYFKIYKKGPKMSLFELKYSSICPFWKNLVVLLGGQRPVSRLEMISNSLVFLPSFFDWWFMAISGLLLQGPRQRFAISPSRLKALFLPPGNVRFFLPFFFFRDRTVANEA